MGVEVTFRCGGCTRTEPGTQPIRNRFCGVTGKPYGFGTRVEDKVSSVAPEGWVAFDPYTQCTYCPDCWQDIAALAGLKQRRGGRAMCEALDRIRDYYPEAEVVPVDFRGERIGFGVRLQADEVHVCLAPDKRTAAKKAADILISGGSIPDED